MTCSKCGNTGFKSDALLKKHRENACIRTMPGVLPSRFALPANDLQKLESVRS